MYIFYVFTLFSALPRTFLVDRRHCIVLQRDIYGMCSTNARSVIISVYTRSTFLDIGFLSLRLVAVMIEGDKK